jgi:large subunit ribosomal protein L21
MYAVIKTGGKQYRVQPGDLLVVEKLEGEAGADVSFDQVLMLGGEGGELTVGAPVIDGAVVRATLIETRKGDKVKVFKKIRRQGYRRTRGHRQQETVLRVTALEGAGVNEKWDGVVDLTPLSELKARARGLAPRVAAAPAKTAKAPKPVSKPTPPSAPPEAEAAQPEKAAAKAPAAKAKPKAEAKPAAEKKPAAAAKTAKAEAKPAPKAKKAEAKTTDDGAAKKPAAKAKTAAPKGKGDKA